MMTPDLTVRLLFMELPGLSPGTGNREASSVYRPGWIPVTFQLNVKTREV